MTVAQNEKELSNIKKQLKEAQDALAAANKQREDDAAAAKEREQRLATVETTQESAKRGFTVRGQRSPDQAEKDFADAFSDKPKTYRAVEAGTDHQQGFIPAGAIFTTTQPKGSWMEEVSAKEAKEASGD